MLHVFPETGLLHLIFTGSNTSQVVGLVDIHEQGSAEEADKAKSAAEAERPQKKWVCASRFVGSNNSSVEDFGKQRHRQMGREKVSLVESVVKEDEVDNREARAARIYGRFANVGGREVGEVGVLDPSGDAFFNSGDTLGQVL